MTNSFSVEGIVIEEAFTAPTKWSLSSENDVTNAMNVTHAVVDQESSPQSELVDKKEAAALVKVTNLPDMRPPKPWLRL